MLTGWRIPRTTRPRTRTTTCSVAVTYQAATRTVGQRTRRTNRRTERVRAAAATRTIRCWSRTTAIPSRPFDNIASSCGTPRLSCCGRRTVPCCCFWLYFLSKCTRRFSYFSKPVPVPQEPLYHHRRMLAEVKNALFTLAARWGLSRSVKQMRLKTAQQSENIKSNPESPKRSWAVEILGVYLLQCADERLEI
uniref:Uncharacterized protein n=1 Tax=Anopheles farauti TaxID=69004 RepID=A0A182Q8W1_9DIPT